MLTASIRHGRDGYCLHVAEVPLWALAAETLAESACARLRHPFCRGTWPIGFRFGQRLLSVAARRERERWSAPLPDDQVRQMFPGSVIDFEKE
jgi:hypothetical protein